MQNQLLNLYSAVVNSQRLFILYVEMIVLKLSGIQNIFLPVHLDCKPPLLQTLEAFLTKILFTYLIWCDFGT